jgi:periplasmic divalent cation tolerance protein
LEKHLLILVTVSSENEGERIGETLVKEGLAACTNLVPGVKSIFKWKGEMCKEDEVLMLIKSKESLFEELKNRVIDLHSYDVPEVIAIPIIFGSADYLRWMEEVLKTKNPKS